MLVYGNIRTKVEVDPIDVLTQLKGHSYWYTEEDGKYYRNWEVSAGQHSLDEKKEIDKEEYDYQKAILVVLTYLNNNKYGNQVRG